MSATSSNVAHETESKKISYQQHFDVTYKCCECLRPVILHHGESVLCKNVNPHTGKKCHATQVMKTRIGWSFGTCR